MDAIAAAAAAQQALRAEPWPDDGVIRVRIGIHSGLASPHGRQYVAMAVHQASRVVDAAHGDQILVSADTVGAAGHVDGLTLASLGRFRVRDFDEPLELYRVEGAWLSAEEAAPRVRPADRHNLLRPLTEMVDRETDLRDLPNAVLPGRAVTLVGPGGVGKTRVAVECGLRLIEQWPDGVWFVDLSLVENGSLVTRTVAAALGLHVPSDAEPLEHLVDTLVARPSLLIIDNAEHVRQATARLVASILQRCPASAVLSTSRERLGIRGETIRHIGPLPVHRTTDDPAVRGPAVQLFCRRAVPPAGGWPPQDMSVIAELCDLLDGLPLAIEMAAARTTAISPTEILAGVRARSTRLANDDPTVEVRHRSLGDLLQWSDDLLDHDERVVFHRLGLFAGTFTHDLAAAAVGTYGGLDAGMIPEIIWSLANKSLVTVEPGAGATRYRLLGTVRTFARQRCGTDETVAAALRLTHWYEQRIGPGLALDLAWTGQMADEIDNIRGLIETLADSHCRAAQRLACSIGQYLDLKQAYSQGIDELGRYAQLLSAPTAERVGLLTRLAGLQLRVGDVDQAATILTAAATLQEQVGPAPWDDVSVERCEGEMALRRGEYEQAAELAERMLRADLSVPGQGRMWNLLGIARISAGENVGGAEAFEREVDSWRRIGREALLVSAHGNLAEALIRCGDHQRAAAQQLMCLELAVQYGQPLMVAYSAMVAARFSADFGDWPNAARLQAFADAELERIGFVMYPADRKASDDLLAEAGSHLDTYQRTADDASIDRVGASLDLIAQVLVRVGQQDRSRHEH